MPPRASKSSAGGSKDGDKKGGSEDGSKKGPGRPSKNSSAEMLPPKTPTRKRPAASQSDAPSTRQSTRTSGIRPPPINPDPEAIIRRPNRGPSTRGTVASNANSVRPGPRPRSQAPEQANSPDPAAFQTQTQVEEEVIDSTEDESRTIVHRGSSAASADNPLPSVEGPPDAFPDQQLTQELGQATHEHPNEDDGVRSHGLRSATSPRASARSKTLQIGGPQRSLWGAGNSPDNEPTPGVGTAVLPAMPPISFWAVFRNEVQEALQYLGKMRVRISFCLALLLFWLMLCSAGPICQHNSTWAIIELQMKHNMVESLCLLSVYTLLMASVYDCLEGATIMVECIGVRAAQTSHLHKSWAGFFTIFLPRVGSDLLYHSLEPALMLWLTLALPKPWIVWLLSLGTPPSDGVVICSLSFLLHLAKWFLQTVEIYYDDKATYRIRFRVKSPLVYLVSVILALLAVYHNWEYLYFGNAATNAAAKAYWQGDRPRTGNETIVSIRNFIDNPATEIAIQAYRVTQILTTRGVLPTLSTTR